MGEFHHEIAQAGNPSADRVARGVPSNDKTLQEYDAGVTLGGPIRKDKLWFFGSIRWQGSKNQKAGIFQNKTQGTPFYTPDLDRPADRREYDRFYAGRLTWQASARNKMNFSPNPQDVCRCITQGTVAPEGASCPHLW